MAGGKASDQESVVRVLPPFLLIPVGPVGMSLPPHQFLHVRERASPPGCDLREDLRLASLMRMRGGLFNVLRV